MTIPVDAIPPSQLFRTLLLHFLETHKLLTPFVRHTPNKELAWCHQQNAYILSEIGSWLEAQIEGTDLIPSFSAAVAAELLVGVASSLPSTAVPPPITGSTRKEPAQPVLEDLRLGFRRAPSSQRRVATRREWERSSTGQIVFLQKSSPAKPDSTLPTTAAVGPTSPANGDNSNLKEFDNG